MNSSRNPAARAPAPGQTVLKGIGFMVVAALILPALNLGAKLLTEEYPVAQVVWARYAGHLAFMVALFAPRRGVGLFRTRRIGTHLTRSVLLLGSTCFYFTALRFVPLPTAAAVGFTGPLIVTLLAIPLLGETVGWRRWVAVGIGFCGALVIIRPGLGAVHWGASLVLVSASLYGLYQILTRKVGATEDPETSVTYTAVVGTIATTAVLPWFWRTPDSLFDTAVFAALGIVAGTGHWFVVKAFQWAPASIVSPFIYVQLLGAASYGYLVFGDVPDRYTWLGAGVIIASGLFIAYREGVVRRRQGDSRD